MLYNGVGNIMQSYEINLKSWKVQVYVLTAHYLTCAQTCIGDMSVS